MCAPLHPAALQCNAHCHARALARCRALLPASALLLRLVRSLIAESRCKHCDTATARDLRLSRAQSHPHTALGRILPPIRDARNEEKVTLPIVCHARALARCRALLPASAPLLRLVRSLTAASWRKRYEASAARDHRLSRAQSHPHTALGRCLPPIRGARNEDEVTLPRVFFCLPASDLRTERFLRYAMAIRRLRLQIAIAPLRLAPCSVRLCLPTFPLSPLPSRL